MSSSSGNNNNDPGGTLPRSTSLRRNMSKSSQAGDGNKPRRQKSLVRPERERNDPNNRLYHYRQRAANGQNIENLAPSTTGNQPSNTTTNAARLSQQQQQQQQEFRPLERKPTARQQLLRRGKSILGREEKQAGENRGGAIAFDDDDEEYNVDKGRSCWAKFNPWMTYCRILTCCIPKQLLRCVGKYIPCIGGLMT